MWTLLLLIALGYGLRAIRFLPEAWFTGLNRLNFWVVLPCMLYREISRTDVREGESWLASGLLLGLAVVTLPLAALLARAVGVVRVSRSALVQSGYRGNLAYIGIPAVAALFPERPEMAGVAALVLAPVVPFYNVLAVFVLQPSGSATAEGRADARRRAAVGIVSNPLVISCCLGIVASAVGFKLPSVLDQAVAALSTSAFAMALLALGAGLSFDRLRGRFGWAAAAALFRVGISPLLIMLATWAVPVGPDLRTVLVVFAACPTAIASYVMAEQMGADKDLAAAVIVLTTLLSFPAFLLIAAWV